MDMGEQSNTRRRIASVERAMEILEAVMELEGARVSELATHLDMAKSTVHNYLSTLHDLNYLVKEGDTYQIGTRFILFGEYSRTRNEEFSMVRQKATNLAEQTEERSQFVIEEFGRGVFLYRESGEHAVEAGSGIGKRMFLHSTAAGKSILAHLPESQVQEILDRWGLPAVTSATITDETELFEELERIRDRGFAINREENIEGLHAVGVPVRTKQGNVIGALSISGPTNRMKGEYLMEELPDLLLGTANELELNIAYS